MNFVRRAAFVTLVSFLPIALGTTGCTSESSAEDEPAGQAPQGDGPSLAIVGGETSNRAFTQQEVDDVVGNTNEIRADGVATTDLSKVLTAQRVEVEAGGKTSVLVRTGDRLELEGSATGMAIEIDGAKFTIVSDAGRWECILTGFEASAQEKMAGAMTLGVLLALDEDLAAQAEEGRCEAVCIIAFSIIVGVGILAALTAYIVCETTGQDRCLRVASTQCGAGKVRSVKKVCSPIASAEGLFKNGRLEFKGGCEIRCR
ncbi:MAG: hypothetical protein KF894_08005 [Labilithrix sp.]|nr:hypothetical protein [Labilithrix sp.]